MLVGWGKQSRDHANDPIIDGHHQITIIGHWIGKSNYNPDNAVCITVASHFLSGMIKENRLLSKRLVESLHDVDRRISVTGNDVQILTIVLLCVAVDASNKLK
jgi:hypothetical protein